jgi:DNA-binding transcriptional MerR regulator/methylmalonyl-CoA mutase cobalamin-binding subunit
MTERLPIRTVAALTGVNPITLRAWERRYGLVRALRTPKGHRLYTQAHVDEIRRVLALTAEGVAMAQVREALRAEKAQPAKAEPHAGPWGEYRRRLAAAIAAFDERALEEIHAETLASHPLERVDRLLLLPALEELGKRWNKVAGGVAEEHFFSAYLRNRIGARFHHRRALDEGPKLLLACAPGEQHEMGLLLFALAAHDAGMRVVLLGANVPFAEAAAAARRANCAAVVLSSAIEPDGERFFDELAQLRESVKRPVFLGGATALAHATALERAGVIALAPTIEDGVRRVAAELHGGRA